MQDRVVCIITAMLIWAICAVVARNTIKAGRFDMAWCNWPLNGFWMALGVVSLIMGLTATITWWMVGIPLGLWLIFLISYLRWWQ